MHLQENGFKVVERHTNQINAVRQQLGVPAQLAGCHTAEVAGYLVEGHVPADLIRKMVIEKPEIVGLAVPGMPVGSPGMPGSPAQPYNVIAWNKQGQTMVYASR